MNIGLNPGPRARTVKRVQYVLIVCVNKGKKKEKQEEKEKQREEKKEKQENNKA